MAEGSGQKGERQKVGSGSAHGELLGQDKEFRFYFICNWKPLERID